MPRDVSGCVFLDLQEDTQREGHGLWSPVRPSPSGDAKEPGKAQCVEPGGAKPGEAIEERFPAIPSLQ
jgi:hypothetical protein